MGHEKDIFNFNLGFVRTLFVKHEGLRASITCFTELIHLGSEASKNAYFLTCEIKIFVLFIYGYLHYILNENLFYIYFY